MIRSAFAALVLSGAAVTATTAAAQDMALDYSWKGVRGCTATPGSPPFTIANVPKGTRSLLFTLVEATTKRELGGQEIAWRGRPNIPAGAVYTINPCVANDYTWTVVAKSEDGQALATATMTKRFPGP